MRKEEQLSDRWFGVGVTSLWIGLAGVVVLIWAMLLGVLPTELPAALTSVFGTATSATTASGTTASGTSTPAPHLASTSGAREPETTGSAPSIAAHEPEEIDSITGAPLTRLGPTDLVAGSDALMHPAFKSNAPPERSLNSQAGAAEARRPVRRDSAAARSGQAKQYARTAHRNQTATFAR